MDKMTKSFEVSSVCKLDLTEHFTKKEISKLTDSDMRVIARKMGDRFCDCCYWDALEGAVKMILEEK